MSTKKRKTQTSKKKKMAHLLRWSRTFVLWYPSAFPQPRFANPACIVDITSVKFTFIVEAEKKLSIIPGLIRCLSGERLILDVRWGENFFSSCRYFTGESNFSLAAVAMPPGGEPPKGNIFKEFVNYDKWPQKWALVSGSFASANFFLWNSGRGEVRF